MRFSTKSKSAVDVGRWLDLLLISARVLLCLEFFDHGMYMVGEKFQHSLHRRTDIRAFLSELKPIRILLGIGQCINDSCNTKVVLLLFWLIESRPEIASVSLRRKRKPENELNLSEPVSLYAL